MARALRLGDRGLSRSQSVDGEAYPEYLCSGGEIKGEFEKLIRPFGFDGLTPAERDQLFAMGTDTRNIGFVAVQRAVPARAQPDRAGTRHGTSWLGRRPPLPHHSQHPDRGAPAHRRRGVRQRHFRLRLPAPKTFVRAPRQRPNWMAVEFNPLYRWHALVPSMLQLGDEKLPIEKTLLNTGLLTCGGLRRFMLAAAAQRAGRIGLFNTMACSSTRRRRRASARRPGRARHRCQGHRRVLRAGRLQVSARGVRWVGFGWHKVFNGQNIQISATRCRPGAGPPTAP